MESTQVMALQQHVTELEQALQIAEQRARIYEAIVQQMPISASVWHLEHPDDPRSFRLVSANQLNKQVTGFDLQAQKGKLMVEIFQGIPDERLRVFAGVIGSGLPCDLGEMTVPDERFAGQVFSVQAIPLANNYVCTMGVNITERKRTAEMLRRSIAQEETIHAQQAALAELSTPLIPISERVVVMPLIGSVDSRRAQQVLDTLLNGVASSGAQIAILDITGVSVVDTQVANALVRAAQAVKLLGAQVMLTGIRPEVAQTLVGLGTDLNDIITRSSLQSGIAYAADHN